MDCGNFNADESRRLVGDPVDVVSGANTYRMVDFDLPGPLPLEWRRYYNSAQNDRLRRLGWGHTHEFDRLLYVDADGLRYMGPDGESIGFPPLRVDGEEFAQSGFVLRRRNTRFYELWQRGQAVMEFEFRTFETPASLKRLRRGQAVVDFRYTDSGYLKEIVDSRRRLIRVEVDPQGRVTGLVLLALNRQDKNRPLITYAYDEAGNLVAGIDAYKHRFSFEYDRNHRLVRRTDRRGYSFQYEYANDGRCVRSRGEDGMEDTRLRYMPVQQTTIVTKADGSEWVYSYDGAGNIIQIVDPYGGKQLFQLDDKGRVAEEIDPNGDITKVLYDAAGAPVGRLSSLGHCTSVPADPDAAPIGAHFVGSCPLEWEYGDMLAGAPISLLPPGHAILSRFPSCVSNSVQTAAGHQPDVAPGKDLAAASGNGRQPESTDGFVYDDLGVLVKELGPGNTYRSWTYDANGNVLRFHDREKHLTTSEYTSWNLLKRTRDPLGHEIAYRYTASGQIAAVTDAGGTESEYAYDLKDRLIQVRRHGAVREEYRYDRADHVLEKRDGEGKPLLSMEIGRAGLTTTRRLASGENHHFAYDETGRLVRAATDELEVLFAYDHFGNRVQDQRDGLGVKHRFRGPDLLETTIFDRFTIRYQRRRDGTLLIRDPGGKEHTIRPLEHGLFVRTLSNGSSEISQFDADGRCLLKSASRPNSPSAAWTRSYGYSPEGDLLLIEDSMRGPSRYSYDASHRLIGAVLPDGTKQTFVYDKAGNLLGQPGLENVVMREGNRLVSVNGNHFQYNQRNHIAVRQKGNAAIRYFYDSLDMLTRCETEHGEWRAQYDPLGRRTHKTYRGKRVDFYWDTDRLVAEVSDGRVRLYVYAHPFALVPFLFIDYDSVQADPSSAKRFFVYSNQVSGPVMVEDESGKTVWRALLDPYGSRQLLTGEDFHMPLHFPGHYLDRETGLHYNRHRYYSPELGRYLQSDPIGLGGGLNLYAYTDNPLTRVDVQGLSCPIRAPGTRRRWTDEEIRAANEMSNRLPYPIGMQRANNGARLQRIYLNMAAHEPSRQLPLTPRQQQINEALGPVDANFTPRRTPLPPGGINSEDLRNLGAHNGLEHGVVEGEDGQPYITRGGPNDPGLQDGDRPLVHSHPGPTPPSGSRPSDAQGEEPGGDVGYARRDDVTRGDPGPYAVVGHDGRITDYGPDGPTPDTRSSYVAQDGTIDGERHPVDPAP